MKQTPKPGLTLDHGALDGLMPMHLALDSTGQIVSVGATLRKVLPHGVGPGLNFFDLFQVRRPGRVQTLEQLCPPQGQKISVMLRLGEQPMFRGAAVPLADAKGVLLNLSFGAGVLEAVRRFHLTESDFAPTDLTMEMLYLVEVKSILTEDLRRTNARLEGETSQARADALTDPLTGLQNRRSLEQTLDKLIETRMPFALMHLDLDFFKIVNDNLGHAAGDFVLQQVAKILLAETRDSDLVVRVGGDEFVLVLPALVSSPKLRAIAQRIINQISRPILFEGQACTISASIGITVSKNYQLATAAEMQADADMALYASKRAGRGRVRLFQSLLPKQA